MKFPISITVTVLALLLFATLPLCTQAQVGQIAEGDVVKIYAPSFDGKSIVGKVDEVASFGLLVSSGKQRITIPYNTIQNLYVSRGQKSRWLLGCALGYVSGAIIATLANKKPENGLDELDNGINQALGASLGALIGAGIGSTIKKDRWKRISLDLELNQLGIYADSYSLSPSLTFSFPIYRSQ